VALDRGDQVALAHLGGTGQAQAASQTLKLRQLHGAETCGALGRLVGATGGHAGEIGGVCHEGPFPSFSVHAECRTGDVVSGKALTVGNHVSRREDAACIQRAHLRSGWRTCCDLLDQTRSPVTTGVQSQYTIPLSRLRLGCRNRRSVHAANSTFISEAHRSCGASFLTPRASRGWRPRAVSRARAPAIRTGRPERGRPQSAPSS
jgi:hypothetical protein